MDNEFPPFEKWHEQKTQYIISYYEYLVKNPVSLLMMPEELGVEISAFRLNPKIQFLFERMMWETRNKIKGGERC